MEKTDYFKFSSLEGKAKDELNEEAEAVHAVFMKLLNAPEAAKRNLMDTDYKIAVAMNFRHKAFAQGESAKIAAIGIVNAQMGEQGGPEFLAENIPSLKVPRKKLKA